MSDRVQWGLRHGDGHVTPCRDEGNARAIRQTLQRPSHRPCSDLQLVRRVVTYSDWTEVPT